MPGFFTNYKLRLSCLDVRGLFALWTLSDLEANFLAFLQCFETVHVDR